MEKQILDPCCGSRMFYFDKSDGRVVFGDKRKLEEILCDGRSLIIDPDVVLDFRKLPFEDEVFSLVVFDPPHLLKLGDNSWMAKKYGKLGDNWRQDLKQGFEECFRVLKKNGVLIFKWNETDIKLSEILTLTPYKPVFGHPSGKRQKTHWVCFLKNV